MAHKIAIVTKNLNFYKKLDALRRSSTQYEMELVKSQDSLNRIEDMGKVISSFIFDDTHSAAEIIDIGKYINRSKKYQSALVFLAFENFETFQTITTDNTFSNAKIINMPASAEEIYAKLTTDTAQVEKKETATATKDTKTSSAQFLNIFIESTMATIKEMAMCEQDITHATPSLLDYQKLDSSIAIRGKLAIKSPYFTGSFFISFPEKTYLSVCSKVLYEEVKEISKDNEDLVSEICNIVYGKSKVLIAKFDMKMDMVIPTYNRDSQVTSSTSILLVKLKSEHGDFYIKVAPGLL